jgi:hypothetical protein
VYQLGLHARPLLHPQPIPALSIGQHRLPLLHHPRHLLLQRGEGVGEGNDLLQAIAAEPQRLLSQDQRLLSMCCLAAATNTALLSFLSPAHPSNRGEVGDWHGELQVIAVFFYPASPELLTLLYLISSLLVLSFQVNNALVLPYFLFQKNLLIIYFPLGVGTFDGPFTQLSCEMLVLGLKNLELHSWLTEKLTALLISNYERTRVSLLIIIRKNCYQVYHNNGIYGIMTHCTIIYLS